MTPQNLRELDEILPDSLSDEDFLLISILIESTLTLPYIT